MTTVRFRPTLLTVLCWTFFRLHAASFTVRQCAGTFQQKISFSPDCPYQQPPQQLQLQRQQCHFVPTTALWSLFSSSDDTKNDAKNNNDNNSNNDNGADADADDDDESNSPSSPSRLRRKRDMIRDWMRSTSSSSPMVRPIRKEDGSIVEDTTKTTSRFKANFGELFSGMPSMSDILGDSSSKNNNNNNDESDKGSGTDDPKRRQKKNKNADESWFDEERKQIEANYEDILQQMLAQLEEQRRQDPEGIPSNAEAMIKDVLRQEMKTEIAAAKEARAKQNLEEYANQQQQSVEGQDLSGVSNELVDNLLKQDQAVREKAQAAQKRIDDYRRYELEAFLRKPDQDSISSAVPIPRPEKNADLDQWALDRLQKMVDSRQELVDDEEFIVTDILEENLVDLKRRMELEAKRSSIKPETLKEWQMYRAIASRLGLQNADKGGDTSTTTQQAEDNEEQIAAQLQSWKDYLVKEDVVRKKSGLARGPRLPFEWQESGREKEIEDAKLKAALESQGEKTKVEIRKEVNRKSIEALEKLIQTSDPVRSARLQKDVQLLKQELESRDYLDIDESLLEEYEEELAGPVDVSDIFSSASGRLEASTSLDSNPIKAGRPPPPTTPFFEGAGDAESRTTPPPNTPFFNELGDAETKPSPPATPFFQDDADIDSTASGGDDDRTSSSGYRLGTIEEQKLRAMYQRAGARTDEEKAAIRAQWEEFQRFEKSRRDESGLTDGDDSQLLSKANIKYDVSDITKEDGDFDAEKILATIGPRPKRKGKAGQSQDDTKRDSNIDSDEVSDSLYRAVAAIGGGRTRDDPEAKAREKAAFSEFIEKENALRQSLDDLDEKIAKNISNEDGTFDDSKYAEDALASLGSRPKPKRRKMSETEYSDKGIGISDDDDDEDDDGDYGTDVEDASKPLMAKDNAPIDKMTSEDDLLPAWLRKERESVRSREEASGERGSFLGSEIDDVFDDDKYEHNMRQLAEYERRRAGGKKQMGIDISDVLGRSSDDYADYNFDDNYFRAKKSGWGEAGFQARKANLMEYTELSVVDLNSLMDHKDSVYSTGVSQYLPRINKPFKEFGAIFRLEGVLIDTTGFQYKAWSKVASEKGFKPPTIEDVRRASVLRPEVAVRDAFFWTDDILLCRDTAAAHRKAMDDVFKEWMKEQGIAPSNPEASGGRGSLALGEETVLPTRAPAMDPLLNASEGEKIKLLVDAWTRTAIVHRLVAPSREQVEIAVVLPPDIAVRKVFQWSSGVADIDKYVATYRLIINDLTGISDKGTSRVRGEPTAPMVEPVQQPRKVLTESAMMELQYKAWTKLAQDNGFELPEPEEVLAAVTINDPEIAIRDGFGWTDDASRIPTLVSSYRDSLSAFVKEWQGESYAPTVTVATETPKEKVPEKSALTSNDNVGPTNEEMIEMQHHAWKSAALNNGFQAPMAEQMQLAMAMSPKEVITRLFRWSEDDRVIQAVCATYKSALKDISQKYIRKYNLAPNAVLFPLQAASTPAYSGQAPTDAPSMDDPFQVSMDAWSSVAKKNGFKMPDEDEVLFAMSVGPEDAVISGFEWASEPSEVYRIVESYKDELEDWRSKRGMASAEQGQQKAEEKGVDSLAMFTVVPGAEKWLKSLLGVEMQCSVVSYFSREQLDVLLEISGFSHLFAGDKRVSASNNYARDVDQLLGAALRNERRPDHCVVFDSSPHSAVAAHDVDMRCVGVIGAFPRYELLTADSTASSFDELTAMNIRRLFGERVYDQPMVDMQQAEPERRTRTKTKFFWDDD